MFEICKGNLNVQIGEMRQAQLNIQYQLIKVFNID